MDKKNIASFYTKVVKDIVRMYFAKEENKLLLQLFKSIAPYIVNVIPVNGCSEKTLIEESKGLALTYSAKYSGMDWMKNFMKLNPKFKNSISQEELAQKLTKFTIIFEHEIYKRIELKDAAKLKLFKARLIGLRRFELAEQQTPISKIIQPIIINVEHEIDVLEQNLPVVNNASLRAVWLKDSIYLSLLLTAMSKRKFSPNISLLEKVFNGENISFQIEQGRLEYFIWLLHELHRCKCYRTTPRKGHFAVFENLIDWDYCNRPVKVSFKKIALKIKQDKSVSNPIKTIVSAILSEAKISH